MVGNDVVDLADPETDLASLHSRFESRAFSACEREALAASASRHRLHWAFWAAKESAYKACKRLEPPTVFSPREFEVELAVLTGTAGTVTGKVHHRRRTLDLVLRFDPESVHALVCTPARNSARLLSGLGLAIDEPGLAVRRTAAAGIATALGLDPAGVRIEDRPPVARHRARTLDVVVSLSHHGRFVAFAAALPAGA